MKYFSQFLPEKDANTQEQAKQLGLAYKGFGYWADPRTGKVTHKTKDKNLVPVSPEEAQRADNKSDQSIVGKAKRYSPETTKIDKLMQGLGTMVGPAGENNAQAPGDQPAPPPANAPAGFNQGQGWDPGPDGDDCVSGEEPTPVGVTPDSFVKKMSNARDWTSGPDGDNIMNTSFREWVETYTEAVNSRGFEPRSDLVNKIRNPSQRSDPERLTYRMADKALGLMGDKSKQQALSNLGRTQKRQNTYGTVPGTQGSYTKGIMANRAADRMAARYKDGKKVAKMNSEAKKFVSNPDFDMDDLGEELGSGAFGSVYESGDGQHVIKQGEIGPGELQALHMLRDNPNFPTLVNANFETPFFDESSMEHNEFNSPHDAANSQGKYFDRDEEEEFERMFPTAKGTYAMTKMAGRPLSDVAYDLDDVSMEQVRRNLWLRRAAMHRLGIAHNDMHGGNIYVDDDNNVNMLDLGLAKANPIEALMEGLGGISGEDYQLSHEGDMGRLPDDLRELLQNNRQSVRDKILDMIEDPDGMNPYQLDDLMEGGIRMRDMDVNNLRETFPFLANDDRVKELIASLYEGIDPDEPSELQTRMANAYDERRKDTDLIDVVNKMRREKGQKSLSIRNPNVVPPRNLDRTMDSWGSDSTWEN